MRTSPPLVVLVLGGAAERWACPEDESPLALASTPHLDRLGSEGRVFGVQLADDPASAAPLLALLGLDPQEHETAHASYLGAMSAETLAPEECFARADFVALFRDMVADVEPGPFRPAEADVLLREAAAAMQRAGFRLIEGADSHHLAVAPRASVDARTPAPESTLGHKLVDLEPDVAQHAFAHRLGLEALDGHEVNEVRRDLGRNGADMVWISGPGGPAKISFAFADSVSAFGIDPVWRGICHVAGIELKAPNAKTPSGLVRGVSQALRTDSICFVYTRRGAQAALRRELGARVESLSATDQQLVGPLARAVAKRGGRLLVVPDTAWSTAQGRPLADPVPAVLWGNGISALSSRLFTEAGAAAGGEPIAPGFGFLEYLQRF